MSNWIPGVSGLSPGEIADGASDAADDVAPDGQVLPQPAEDVYQLSPLAQAVDSSQEALDGDFGEAVDDAAYNVPSFLSGVASGDRENAVLEGIPRDVYDVVADYDGEWGGQEDQYDIPGPSVDPDGNWFGWNSDQSQDDPLKPPDWITGNQKMVAAAILVVVGIWLLRPYVGAADAAT